MNLLEQKMLKELPKMSAREKKEKYIKKIEEKVLDSQNRLW